MAEQTATIETGKANGTNGAKVAQSDAGAADLRAQLEALKAENLALRAARDAGVRVDVNKSGNVRLRVDGTSYAMPAKHARLWLDNASLILQAVVKAEKGER